MASETHPVIASSRSKRGTKDHKSTEERKHRRRRRRRSTTARGEGRSYVYREAVVQKKSGSDADSSSSDEETVKVDKAKPKKIRVVYINENGERVGSSKERRSKQKATEHPVRRSEETIKRSATQTRRQSMSEGLRRTVSSREVPSVSRPSIKRSKTTSSTVPRPQSTPSSSIPAKRSSFMGSFFGGPIKPVEPEKLVECLTCLDDVPKSKAAKLKCGHRMCHSCLRRIFRLSITDPQHMPPKCCTADHIPLEHVDKLFDIKFKKTWNRKFQEFSTKNRIYCPMRKCGEWIKPSHIHKKDGRKYGECSRCKTKVCCLCNGKWHGSKECPRDEETNKLLDAAKEAGWQRCYSCRAMVELKEGCNHMTCRCTAEFCMICGLKWKTCNCPWFNYDAVEADRLEHMNVPDVVEVVEQPNRLRRRQPPNNYQAEMNARRRQEREDEALAQRMQRAAISDDDDYQGGIGDIHGIGNGAGHFMNQDYVRAAQNILTGRFDQATAAANYVMGVREARAPPRRMTGRYPGPNAPPPPLARRQSDREIPERPRPERRRTDYEPAPAPETQARSALLAGLTGRGGNRVNAWRNHVAQGAPEEGVLSV